jgi:hypothetical protein
MCLTSPLIPPADRLAILELDRATLGVTYPSERKGS